MHLGGNQPAATINVTPLIDVLLVLLIIFLVIQPPHSMGLEARAPLEDKNAAPSLADRLPLVITVLGGGEAMLNRERVGAAEFAGRLRQVLALRAEKTVFFTAAPDLEFRAVGEAIDVARGAGAAQVGLLAKPD